MRRAIRVCLLLAVFSLVGLAGSAPSRAEAAPPAAWKQGDPCPQVLLLGARGSGQTFDNDEIGLGEEVYELATALAGVLEDGGLTLAAQGIPYAAVSIFNNNPNLYDSAELGIVIARNMLASVYEQCGDSTQVVLAGYSQGAMVARGVVGNPTEPYHSIVSALILIGDPHYNPDNDGLRVGLPTERRGILGARELLAHPAMTTLHVCAAGDIICQWSGEGAIPENLSTLESYIIHTTAYDDLLMQLAAAATIAPVIRHRCAHAGVTILGTEGDDDITGTPEKDVIIGLGGNDTIHGKGGDDVICAGDGADNVNGGSSLDGDYVEGGDGNDALRGDGLGRDTLDGGGGDDLLEDAQTLLGGPGADVLLASTTASMRPAGRFGTFAYAPSYLDGGDGDDLVTAPFGADYATGGAGDDQVTSPWGYVEGADGDDVLTGGAAGQYLDGGEGEDLLRGEGGDDYLDGGGGPDELHAGDDDDYLDGGDGPDVLWGDAGVDFFDGGAGDDRLEARDEGFDEFFNCGEGSDVLRIDSLEGDPALQDGCEPELPDDVAPTVSIAAPVEGADLDLGERVRASFSCADEGGSGLSACEGTVGDGDWVDTDSRGRKTFTVTATDGAGNRRTASVSYRVRSNQTISFPAPGTRTYGDAPFDPRASASSGRPVTLAASGVCRVAGGRIELTAAGSCTVVADIGDNDEYRPADAVSRTFSVARARLVAAADDVTAVYGVPVTLTGTLTGVVPGDGISAGGWASADGPRSDVGRHAITPVLSDPHGQLGNYALELSGTLTVTPAPLTITGDRLTRIYGDPNPVLTGVIGSQLLVGDDVTVRWSVGAGERAPVGVYETAAQLGGADAANYTVTLTPGALTVTPRPLSVIADDVSRPFGASDVPLTGTLTGLLAGDAVSGRYTTEATASSRPGRYPIRAEAAGDPAVLANYAIDARAGVLTITDEQAPVLVVPGELLVEATGPDGAVVAFGDRVSATDDVLGALTPACAPAAGQRFALGTTRVECTASDGTHTTTASFTVRVVDTTAPVLTLPAVTPVVASSTSGAVVTWDARAADTVDGPVAVACSPASGAVLPIGLTTVTCSATDRAGNRAQGTFPVRVLAPTSAQVTAELVAAVRSSAAYGRLSARDRARVDALVSAGAELIAEIPRAHLKALAKTLASVAVQAVVVPGGLTQAEATRIRGLIALL